jgi:Molybdate transporter of MFS superfamily
MAEPKGEKFILSLRELRGALGDLGTLLPLMLGTIAVVGLAPTPVLAGFALFYIATAAYYRLPIPVQPMKAVAAVLLTAGITPPGLAASGVMIGVALLVLGLTGWITRLARLVPQSVLAGLQMGLGLALALVSLNLMATAPVIGMVTLCLLLGFLLAPRYPSAVIGLAIAILLAQVLDVPGMQFGTMVAFSIRSCREVGGNCAARLRGHGGRLQAARSRSLGERSRVGQPSTRRMVIWPDARSAQNSIAAVSAQGSRHWVLMRRLNSSCRRSMAFVVLSERHCSGG